MEVLESMFIRKFWLVLWDWKYFCSYLKKIFFLFIKWIFLYYVLYIENLFFIDDVSNNIIRYMDDIWVIIKFLVREKNDLFNEGGKW